jgi:hypothetical protein
MGTLVSGHKPDDLFNYFLKIGINIIRRVVLLFYHGPGLASHMPIV